MRRIAAALLMLCVTAATVNDPAGIYGVKAAEVQERNTESTEDSFEYEELANGGLKLTKYKGSGTKAVIPSAINGKTVAIIGNEAFSGCTGLESITIPNSVTNIGEGTGYTEYEVFDECSGLKEIIVEEGNAWYSSQDGILYNKEKTKLILCPAGKEGSAVIAEGVTEISYVMKDYITFCSAISGCSNLRNISIPKSLVTLINEGNTAGAEPYHIFTSCSSLEEILVDSNNTGYSSQDGILYNKEQTGLLICPAGKKGSIIISASVTYIGKPYMDSTCYNIFDYCGNLTDILVDSGNLMYSSQDGILYNKEKTELICCPVKKTGCITIPDGVMAVGEYAFSGCGSLEEILIPDGIQTIGSYAFKGCCSLTEITIPKSVVRIGPEKEEYGPGAEGNYEHLVFKNCNNLEEIIVDSNNKAYSSYEGVLYNKEMTQIFLCPAGKEGSITIPKSVTYLEDRGWNINKRQVTMFQNCSRLTDIKVDEGHEKYISLNGVLYSKDMTCLLCCPVGKAGSITIPDGVQHIGRYAFSGCSGLTNVSIPDSLIEDDERAIGAYAFSNCSSLTKIILSGKTSEPIAIGIYAFKDCNSLTEVELQGVHTVDIGSFEGCGSLKRVFMWGVEHVYIDEYAFHNCSNLASFTIEAESAEFGRSVFEGCGKSLCIRCMGGDIVQYAIREGINYEILSKKAQVITASDYVKTVGDADFPIGASTNGNGELSYTSDNESAVIVSSKGVAAVIGTGTAQITITAAETDEYAAAQKVITITVNPASGTGETPAPPADLVGTSYDIGGCTFTITSVEPKEACFTRLNDEECTSVTMRSVMINGVEYEVSSIAERACCGMETLQRVYIGENVKEIGAGAFAGCAALEQVEIPESVQSIGEDAFAGCSDGFCIICARGSAAEAYAVENGIRHKASADEKELQTITADDFEKTFGDGPFSIEAATDGDGALSYESDNESVAAVSAKGTVFLMGTGTARITIRASGTENYEPAEKTITITVNPKPGEGQSPGTGNNNQQNPGNKKAQTITAADIAKTYGDRQFPIGAGTDSGGTLSYTVKNPAVAAIDGNGTVTLKGCGRTEIVITAAAYGEYTAAEKTITLTVAPKKLKGISAKSTKAGTLTVKWKKDAAASGYIIECSTDRKFRKNVKTATVKKNKTTSKKMTKLKSGKKYYVRACAYAQAGGAKIKGAYTVGKKAVKVKK